MLTPIKLTIEHLREVVKGIDKRGDNEYLAGRKYQCLTLIEWLMGVVSTEKEVIENVFNNGYAACEKPGKPYFEDSNDYYNKTFKQ